MVKGSVSYADALEFVSSNLTLSTKTKIARGVRGPVANRKRQRCYGGSNPSSSANV